MAIWDINRYVIFPKEEKIPTIAIKKRLSPIYVWATKDFIVESHVAELAKMPSAVYTQHIHNEIPEMFYKWLKKMHSKTSLISQFEYTKHSFLGSDYYTCGMWMWPFDMEEEDEEEESTEEASETKDIVDQWTCGCSMLHGHKNTCYKSPRRRDQGIWAIRRKD